MGSCISNFLIETKLVLYNGMASYAAWLILVKDLMATS